MTPSTPMHLRHEKSSLNRSVAKIVTAAIEALHSLRSYILDLALS